MNDRIQELKHQAYLWCDENIPERFSEEDGGYGTDWENKFAELIVHECIMQVRKQSFGEVILGGQRYKTVQLHEAIAAITEHFGVE